MPDIIIIITVLRVLLEIYIPVFQRGPSVAPTINGSVQITGGSGTRTLVYGTDYTTGFVTGATNCTYTIIGQSAAAALDPNENLVINYNAELDPDNGNGVALTNYAGATQWFSQDTSGTGATGQTYTYTGPLTDGTPGTLDNQDKYTVLTASTTLSVTKTVFHADSTPAPTAKPGETLHYVVTITNTSDVPLPNFSLVDDIGLLNSTAVFVSGSLANVTVTGSTADMSHDNPTGGKNGAGLLDIRNLVLGTQTKAERRTDSPRPSEVFGDPGQPEWGSLGDYLQGAPPAPGFKNNPSVFGEGD